MRDAVAMGVTQTKGAVTGIVSIGTVQFSCPLALFRNTFAFAESGIIAVPGPLSLFRIIRFLGVSQRTAPNGINGPSGLADRYLLLI